MTTEERAARAAYETMILRVDNRADWTKHSWEQQLPLVRVDWMRAVRAAGEIYIAQERKEVAEGVGIAHRSFDNSRPTPEKAMTSA